MSNRSQPESLPEDLDGWLAEQEQKFGDIVPGTEKQIFWAGEAGARTPLSIVYLHGFSATLGEIRPVPDRVAAALGRTCSTLDLPGMAGAVRHWPNP